MANSVVKVGIVGNAPIDAAPDQPRFYQWDTPLSEIYPRNSVRKTSKMGDLPSPSEYVKLVNSSVSHGDVQVDYVEITAPIYEQWPPDSHTRVFIDSANKTDETIYAREVLTNFMSRAWRRGLAASEIDQKLAEIRKRNGGKRPDIVYILIDDMGFGGFGECFPDPVRWAGSRPTHWIDPPSLRPPESKNFSE